LQEELARAQARWHAKPSLGDCAKALSEKADLELCQAAASALEEIAREATPTPELALTRLAPGALALVRLSQRLRYLSLAELAQRHVDGGTQPAPSSSAASVASAIAASRLHQGKRAAHGEQHALELGEGPVSQLMGRSIHLERDVIRNLGAYLEYGPLPLRRAAFETVKQLFSVHPEWPSLAQLVREAVVLESDADLRRRLRELPASGQPQGGAPLSPR
jgi:hypothetical protein